MEQHGHQQKDVMRLSKQSQPQVSKFLAGHRHRVTPSVVEICRYAGIDVETESGSLASPVPLSQSVRQVLEHNPRAAELVARVIEALMPVLSNLYDTANASPKEA